MSGELGKVLEILEKNTDLLISIHRFLTTSYMVVSDPSASGGYKIDYYSHEDYEKKTKEEKEKENKKARRSR